MNCVICSSPMPNAIRSTRKYCSERCRYRAKATVDGRREYVPVTERDGSDATYAGIHKRLQTAYGKASDHPCVSCGAPAAEWAYDHSDPNERSDGGLTYSGDLNRYSPMCKRCHRDFDNAATGRRAKCGTTGGYDRHRRVTKTPACQPCKDALAARARAYTASITHYQEQP